MALYTSSMIEKRRTSNARPYKVSGDLDIDTEQYILRLFKYLCDNNIRQGLWGRALLVQFFPNTV
jgi:hypothetical protein